MRTQGTRSTITAGALAAATSVLALPTGGTVYSPSRIVAPGWYARSQSMKSPAGAGSQFDSWAAGDAVWKYMSREPSAFGTSPERSPTAYRFAGFATSRFCASVIVSDQNASFGGRPRGGKWST